MAIPCSFGRRARLALVLLAGGSLAACASMEPRYPSQGGKSGPGGMAQGERKIGKPYQVGGIWYVPREQPNYDETGIASWYGQAFHMKTTANGELFDMNAVSAAHTTLPIPSMVEVTNLDNGRRLMVRVNDRGPFVDNRIIDLSQEAARQLGYDRAGLARVRVRYVGPASLTGPADGVRVASLGAPMATRVVATPAKPAPLPAYGAAPGYDPVMEIAAGSPPRAAMATSPGFGSGPLPPVTGAEISSAPIGSAPLAPLKPVASTELPPLAPAPAGPVLAAANDGLASALRVQAGAFSSQANAQQAVARLAPAGLATIEPLQRADGLTLYRVVLPAPADEAAAYALRDRVAEIGFSDARVVRTF
ncbi:MAG: septal ring lytic transglycosylase RlpA family protein [Phenylobacterium zucineum]|nr:MAG: septal ring lytic transglycosylase RlpA family protein [Phenylobacterium zucineum]